jgi:poly(3-hydroxybutyrate) depolymerase
MPESYVRPRRRTKLGCVVLQPLHAKETTMRSSILLAAAAGAAAASLLPLTLPDAQAENKLRSYIPIGAAADPTSQGAGGTWAWFIDATRNRVVYCAAASFQTPPECRDGIIP